MNTKVILLAGRKRSGKDTFASVLKDEAKLLGKTLEIISFATPMKDMLSITLGITIEELDTLKNISSNPHRGYLQRLGTEAMKKYFGNDVWAKLLQNQVEQSTADVIVVPDFRFPIEAMHKATTVKVIRPNLAFDKDDRHPSETALNSFDFDVLIRNDGTVANLVPQARQLLKLFG